MQPYTVSMRHAAVHGVLAGVTLPTRKDDVPAEVLDQLHDDEQVLAQRVEGFRRISFVGGRLAARAAIASLGLRPVPVVQGERGAPKPRGRVSVSITHKRDLAIALAARDPDATLGVDLEDLAPERPGIAERILTPTELAQVRALPDERQWTAVLLRFVVKEAIYKALAPRLKRYIDFDEAEVEPMPDGTALVGLRLAEGEPVPDLDARFIWLDGRVVGTVRATWPEAAAKDSP